MKILYSTCSALKAELQNIMTSCRKAVKDWEEKEWEQQAGW